MGWFDALLSKATGTARRAADADSDKAQDGTPSAPDRIDRLDAASFQKILDALKAAAEKAGKAGSLSGAKAGLAALIGLIVLGGAVGIVGSRWISAALQSHVNSFGVEVPVSQRPTNTPTTVPQSLPAFIPDANKPLAEAPCVPPPAPAYPPDGALRSANTLVRWTSTVSLQDGEQYVVLATQDSSELQDTAKEQLDSVASTRNDNAALDFSTWKYAGRLGRFFWIVRIQSADGRFIDCDGTAPLAFVVRAVAEATKPSGDARGGEGNNPPPPPNPNPKP